MEINPVENIECNISPLHKFKNPLILLSKEIKARE